MTEFSGIERRASPRYDVALRVHAADLGEVQALATRDVSLGGLFLETTRYQRKGTVIPLALIDETNGTEIPLMARVVRIVKTEGEVKGVGVEFLHMHETLRARVQELVARIARGESGEEPPLPGDAVPKLLKFSTDRSGHTLTGAQQHIVAFVNGQSTVDEIVRASGLEYPDATKRLTELIDAGLVTLGDATTQAHHAEEKGAKLRAEFTAKQVTGYVERAAQALREDHLPEAVRLLELALKLRPQNAHEIHLRLAQVAVTRLGNLDMGERHAVAAKALDPENVNAARLLDTIAMRRADAADDVAAGQSRATPTRRTDARAAGPVSQRRTMAVLVGTVVVLMAAYNVWRFAVPKGGDRPVAVSTEVVSQYIPHTLRAQHQANQLVLTVDPEAWESLEDKEAQVIALYGWASSELGVTRVVIADEAPTLLAVATPDQTRIYR